MANKQSGQLAFGMLVKYLGEYMSASPFSPSVTMPTSARQRYIVLISEVKLSLHANSATCCIGSDSQSFCCSLYNTYDNKNDDLSLAGCTSSSDKVQTCL